MLVLSIDFESTGLNVAEDHVIEVGMALYSTGQRKILESSGYLVKSDKPISEEITKITGIHPSAVEKFGFDSKDALQTVIELIQVADAVAGQNVIQFDKRMLESWGKRESASIPDKLWLDTLTDLPGVEGKHLGYMAADAGFLNLFPHSALTDCLTVVKLLMGHDIDKVVERAKSPLVVLQAHQDRANNDQAKKLKFRWKPERKIWWKVVKEMDVDELVKSAPFDISIEKDTPVEELWYD
jgi:DNA polymerase III epsilon subunit-like protein